MSRTTKRWVGRGRPPSLGQPVARGLALREAFGAAASLQKARARPFPLGTGYLGLAPLICSKLMRQKGWEESFFASAVLSSCVAGIVANVATRSRRMLRGSRTLSW
jgi:hypothetical protein